MSHPWTEFNQQSLTRALAEVRAALESHARKPGPRETSERATAAPAPPVDEPPATLAPPTLDVTMAPTALDETMAPPALDVLAQRLGLSSFERAILLLCAGIELDASLGNLCAAAQGDASRTYPTFS